MFKNADRKVLSARNGRNIRQLRHAHVACVKQSAKVNELMFKSEALQ